MPYYTTQPHKKQTLFILFYCFFIHFLLDKVFSKNLCKSLTVNELRGRDPPVGVTP